jgi:cell division control protein 6
MLAIAKSKNGFTGEVYDLYSSLCSRIDQKPLTQRRVTQIIREMELLGVISTEVVNQGRYGRSQKAKIAVPVATIKDALKDDPVFSELIAAASD